MRGQRIQGVLLTISRIGRTRADVLLGQIREIIHNFTTN